MKPWWKESFSILCIEVLPSKTQKEIDPKTALRLCAFARAVPYVAACDAMRLGGELASQLWSKTRPTFRYTLGRFVSHLNTNLFALRLTVTEQKAVSLRVRVCLLP